MDYIRYNFISVFSLSFSLFISLAPTFAERWNSIFFLTLHFCDFLALGSWLDHRFCLRFIPSHHITPVNRVLPIFTLCVRCAALVADFNILLPGENIHSMHRSRFLTFCLLPNTTWNMEFRNRNTAHSPNTHTNSTNERKKKNNTIQLT